MCVRNTTVFARLERLQHASAHGEGAAGGAPATQCHPYVCTPYFRARGKRASKRPGLARCTAVAWIRLPGWLQLTPHPHPGNLEHRVHSPVSPLTAGLPPSGLNSIPGLPARRFCAPASHVATVTAREIEFDQDCDALLSGHANHGMAFDTRDIASRRMRRGKRARGATGHI